MQYFELTCTAYIKKDISFRESFFILSRYISTSMAMDESLKVLHDNLEKKYQAFYDKPLQAKQEFIQLIEIIKNEKSIRFFGNKFRIIPHEDDVSQKLAFMALGSGLGEKSSFGGGFCVSGGKR